MPVQLIHIFLHQKFALPTYKTWVLFLDLFLPGENRCFKGQWGPVLKSSACGESDGDAALQTESSVPSPACPLPILQAHLNWYLHLCDALRRIKMKWTLRGQKETISSA